MQSILSRPSDLMKALTCLICLLPSLLARPLLRILGHSIGKRAYIGFSLIWCEHLAIGNDSRIGHLNVIKGPLKLRLGQGSKIGNRNVIKRAPRPVTYGEAAFVIGDDSGITSSHIIDCTRSVTLGDHTAIAGLGTQVWTHGYFHVPREARRFRVDGEVIIGNDCYIGSACYIGPNVAICDGVTVGAHAAVSKSLSEPGLYVSQPLRFLPSDLPAMMSRLTPIEGASEAVYVKEKDGSAKPSQ